MRYVSTAQAVKILSVTISDLVIEIHFLNEL